MRINGLLILVAVFVGTGMAQPGGNADVPQAAAAAAPEVAPDTAASVQDTAARCTLEVRTVPDGATVLFNGVVVGISPVTIPGVDVGKHTIVLQKAGYYQKKAVVTINEIKPTALDFELSAPGRLTITTVPDSADVYLDEVHKGFTPFTDSLLKPGSYAVRLEKESYVTITDTVTIGSAASVALTDTLVHPASYTDSIAYAVEVAHLKKKRLTLGLVGGTFGFFLLFILAIEGRDR